MATTIRLHKKILRWWPTCAAQQWSTSFRRRGCSSFLCIYPLALKKQRHACHFTSATCPFADAKCLCRSSRTYASSEETVTVALALVPLSIVYLGNSCLVTMPFKQKRVTSPFMIPCRGQVGVFCAAVKVLLMSCFPINLREYALAMQNNFDEELHCTDEWIHGSTDPITSYAICKQFIYHLSPKWLQTYLWHTVIPPLFWRFQAIPRSRIHQRLPSNDQPFWVATWFPGLQLFCDDTVDGRNPAPVDRWFIPLFLEFQPSQVVQDFLHPPYVPKYVPKEMNYWVRNYAKTIGSPKNHRH